MLHFSSQPPEAVFYSRGPDCPAGALLIGCTDKGWLCRVGFLAIHGQKDIVSTWQAQWPETSFMPLRTICTTLPKKILLVGTPFRQKVWEALLTIPKGKTLSYAEMAAHIGAPKALRAIGGALGDNPVPFVIPCHRVISSDGSLGGFSGGHEADHLAVKRALLNHEGVQINH